MSKINPAHYAKAIAAAASTLGAGYAIAIQAGSPGGDGITAHEWQGIAITTVLSFILTWSIPNVPSEPSK
jgi:hypothetical protein